MTHIKGLRKDRLGLAIVVRGRPVGVPIALHRALVAGAEAVEHEAQVPEGVERVEVVGSALRLQALQSSAVQRLGLRHPALLGEEQR